ncbi:hypothetical protein [Sphingomonas psychrotolerans]|uniref:hypothetical protein n=1 Tax=Sphingomonas psychrotolerans TaxID=1327635 RepID=UPI0013050D56|nr:hypothetical protein [Sphingomonas psychrotolerans]
MKMIISCHKDKLTVVVEPWAAEFVIRRGQSIDIVFSENQHAEEMELLEDDTITLSAPPGVTCVAEIDGVNVSGASMSNPSP